ncbi:MAG: hypothetical protein IBV53_07235 [Candidatus Atribacteria bacterium]
MRDINFENCFFSRKFRNKRKKVIKKFSTINKISNYEIYSINKDNNIDGAKYLNVNKKFYEIQDLAFYLLNRRKKEVEETAEILSKITDLDLKMFTKRLLINKLFYKEAQLLIGEEILLKEKEIKEVVILSRYRDILNNKNNVITYYNEIFDIYIFIKTIVRYIINIFILLFKKIKNYDRKKAKLSTGEYVILAILSTPLGYNLIKKSLKSLNRKYSIAITSGYSYSKEIIPFKIKDNIKKIKIYPSVCINDFFNIIIIFDLLKKIKKYKFEVINIFCTLLYRKKLCEFVSENIKPKAVLVKNEYDLFENVEYAVFNKYGIKYIDYIHGEKIYNIGDSFLEYYKMIVWGNYCKILLENKLKAKSKMIEVVGNQLFDKIPSYICRDNKLLELKNNKYKKIISVFTQRSYRTCDVNDQTLMIQKVVKFMEQNKNIFLILKHHHLEYKYTTPLYNSLIKSIEERVFEFTNEKNLYDILSISDLIVTPYYIVGLEAILFKKPVIYMIFGEVPKLMEQAKVNAAVEINKPEETDYYLYKMLFDKKFIENIKYKIVIKELANNVDGKACIKFTKLIEQVLKRN